MRICEKTFTQWLDEQPDYGLYDPPMDAQLALNYLFDYLNIPPITVPQSVKQCNTYVLYMILMRYSPDFRKEHRKWVKGKRTPIKKHNKLFNRVKKKDRKFGQYPCDVFLHNALRFISEGNPDVAYKEICHALLKAGDSLSDEERWRFERILEDMR